LPLRDHVHRALVHHYLMIPGFHEPARDMFQLLAGLDQKVVARRDFNRDAAARVASPDVEPRVSRAAVNGEEVEIGVETGEDGVDLAVPFQVRRRWGEKVGAIRRVSGSGAQEDVRWDSTNPYLPALLNVSAGRPRPTAVISARPETLHAVSVNITRVSRRSL